MVKKGETIWTPEEERQLAVLYSYHGSDANKWKVIAEALGKTDHAVRAHWRMFGERLRNRLEASPYPRYDEPLTAYADKALVLPDPEFPFHHADFLNRTLDLAQAWGIDYCVIAGDMLHFDSLSSWQPSWTTPNKKGGLNEQQEKMLVDFFKTLGSRQQERGFDLLEKIGPKTEDGNPNVSEELRVARKAIKTIMQCFKYVDVDLGNHEGRILRQLNSPLFPTEILRLVEAQSFRIAPFYYSILWSNNVKYYIEHPKNFAPYTAEKLASKYQANVICAHSHLLKFSWDMSGSYYAISSGCTVDESRLPYASQRHNTSPTHGLGATIVRDGVPYLLHINTDWEKMARMA